MRLKAIIMAAGQGTRMRSKLPKVLHPLLGKPLIQYSVDMVKQVTGENPVVVIGHGGDAVRQKLGEQAEYVLQAEQLGTGHAVKQAESLVRGNSDLVLVVAADMPLLTAATLQQLVDVQEANPGPLTLLTLLTDQTRGFGRVVRDGQGNVRAIVEEAQATAEQLAIKELNAGAYCFRSEWLWGALPRIPLSPKGEYYLTDLVGMLLRSAMVQAVCLDEASEAIGITLGYTAEPKPSAGADQSRLDAGWSNADRSSDNLIEHGYAWVIRRLANTYLRRFHPIGEAVRLVPTPLSAVQDRQWLQGVFLSAEQAVVRMC